MRVAVAILALPIPESVPGHLFAILETLDGMALFTLERLVLAGEGITSLLAVIELLEFETGCAVAIFAGPIGFRQSELSSVSIFMAALTLSRHAAIGGTRSTLLILGGCNVTGLAFGTSVCAV